MSQAAITNSPNSPNPEKKTPVHSPLPWKFSTMGGFHTLLIDANEQAVGNIEGDCTIEEDEANRDLILRIFNSHQALVDACERALRLSLANSSLRDQLEAALRLAKGGQK